MYYFSNFRALCHVICIKYTYFPSSLFLPCLLSNGILSYTPAKLDLDVMSQCSKNGKIIMFAEQWLHDFTSKNPFQPLKQSVSCHFPELHFFGFWTTVLVHSGRSSVDWLYYIFLPQYYVYFSAKGLIQKKIERTSGSSQRHYSCKVHISDGSSSQNWIFGVVVPRIPAHFDSLTSVDIWQKLNKSIF